MKTKALISILTLIFHNSMAMADEIIFKSGSKIQCEVVKETSDTVEYDFQGKGNIIVTMPKDNITEIIRSSKNANIQTTNQEQAYTPPSTAFKQDALPIEINTNMSDSSEGRYKAIFYEIISLMRQSKMQSELAGTTSVLMSSPYGAGNKNLEETWSSYCNAAISTEFAVQQRIKDLANPPSEYAAAYRKLIEIYPIYLELSQKAKLYTGRSWTNEVGRLDSELDNELRVLEVLIPR